MQEYLSANTFNFCNGLFMENLGQKILKSIPFRGIGRKFVNKRGFMLDSQIQIFLAVSGLFKQAHEEKSIEHARKSFAFFARQGLKRMKSSVDVRNFFIAGSKRKIPLRLYVPDSYAQGSGLIMFMHGGGWVLGNLDSHDLICRKLAAGTSQAVLAVDYALAPKHPYPAALNEALDVYQWLRSRAYSVLGVNGSIVFCGDSAGANLVTALCLLCQRMGIEQPRQQVLFYPVTDLLTLSKSRNEFATGFLLSQETMMWFENKYLQGQDPRNPLISPVYAEDCSQLAPAMIFLAGFDILFDEGLAYAKRLESQGLAVDLHLIQHQIHAFASLSGLVPSASKDFSHCISKISQRLASLA